MVVGVQAEKFLRDELEGQQKLGAIGQQQVHVAARRILPADRDFRNRVAAVADSMEKSS